MVGQSIVFFLTCERPDFVVFGELHSKILFLFNRYGYVRPGLNIMRRYISYRPLSGLFV